MTQPLPGHLAPVPFHSAAISKIPDAKTTLASILEPEITKFLNSDHVVF
jgi:hypothetical protein